jgi:hypothetical protein
VLKDTLEIAGNFASIESKSLWGALRALGKSKII